MSSSTTYIQAMQQGAFLAPLAGVGDPMLRSLCKEQGAALTFTEMVSAKGLEYGNANTHDLVTLAPGEEYCGVQLFGHEPDIMADQAARIEEELGEKLAVIDINMGCPVTKVVKRGEGSALMKTPELAQEVVASIVKAVSVPVSVKMRRGWLDGSFDCVDLALRVQEAGAVSVCVHGRSATQLYRGTSSLEPIARVKEVLSIPVIGNGDLNTVEDIERMLAETGVDNVMIARGAMGNPWLFAQAKALKAGEPIPELPGTEAKLLMLKRHVAGLCELDPRRGVTRMRKHLPHYIYGVPHAAAVRNGCMVATEPEQLLAVVDEALGYLHEQEAASHAE